MAVIYGISSRDNSLLAFIPRYRVRTPVRFVDKEGLRVLTDDCVPAGCLAIIPSVTVDPAASAYLVLSGIDFLCLAIAHACVSLVCQLFTLSAIHVPTVRSDMRTRSSV